MQSLKILVVSPSFYQDVSNTSEIFHNLFPILKKKVTTKIVWVNYQPEKINMPSHDNPDVINLDLRNYNDALDILRKEKPDFVYVSPYESFVDIAFIYASRSLKIPTVNLLYYTLERGAYGAVRVFSLFRPHLKRLLSNTVPSESKSNKTFLRRGRFILYKFQFLLKTIKKTNNGFLQKISIILFVLKITFFNLKKIDPRLTLSLFLVQNKNIERYLLSSNIDSNIVKLTGNPMYDKIYYSLKNKSTHPRQNKIRILLLPIAFEEYGNWTKEQATKILSDIVTNITSNKDKFSLTVKFHPTASTIYDHEKIIHSINPEIKVYKTGNVTDYFDNTDVIIIYSTRSTAAMYALLAKIPIILYNFFDFKDDLLLNEGLVLECKESSTLIKKIEESLNFNIKNKRKIEESVNNFLFSFDGKSAERVSHELLEFKKNYHY